MDLLISEDLLLLLLDDESGRTTGSFRDLLLGGALLADLAVRELVTVGPKEGLWRSAKVHATGEAPADPDPVLAGALADIVAKPRSAQDVVRILGKGARNRLAERLVERGILRREEGKVLGLFPRTSWPAADSAHERQVRGALAAAVLTGIEPDDHVRALVAILSAGSLVPKVLGVRGEEARRAKARAKELAQGTWAAAAVKDAIDAATAAMIVAASAGGAAAASS